MEKNLKTRDNPGESLEPDCSRRPDFLAVSYIGENTLEKHLDLKQIVVLNITLTTNHRRDTIETESILWADTEFGR